MNLVKTIKYLFPNAKMFIDFEVRDNSNGEGPYIHVWNVKDAAGNQINQPTLEEMKKAWEVCLKEEEVSKPISEIEQKLARLEESNEALKIELAEKDRENKNALFEIYNMLLDS